MNYKNKNKAKREHGYENRRMTDMMANMFGGMLGKTVKTLKKERRKIEQGK